MTEETRRRRPVTRRMVRTGSSNLARTKYEREVYSHRQLWKAAQVMRDHAEANEAGALYFNMAAMRFARLTVEAYCNFVIDVIDPETFKREKKEFGSSTDKKLAWASEKTGFPLDPGRRPYQTLTSLNTCATGLFTQSPKSTRDKTFTAHTTNRLSCGPASSSG